MLIWHDEKKMDYTNFEECKRKLRNYQVDVKKPFLFVSYKREDADKVYPFVCELIDKGIDIWIDLDNMNRNIGNSWQKPAMEAIEAFECRGILFFASKNSFGSAPCLAELLYSQTKMIRDRHEDTFKIMSVDADNIIANNTTVNKFIKSIRKDLDRVLDPVYKESIFNLDLFDDEKEKANFLSKLKSFYEVATSIAKVTELNDEKVILAQTADQIVETCSSCILPINSQKLNDSKAKNEITTEEKSADNKKTEEVKKTRAPRKVAPLEMPELNIKGSYTLGDIRKTFTEDNKARAFKAVREDMPHGGKGAMDYLMASVLGGCNGLKPDSPTYQNNYYYKVVANDESSTATWTWSSNCRKVLGIDGSGQIPNEIDGYFKSLSENTTLNQIADWFINPNQTAFTTKKNAQIVTAINMLSDFLSK